MALSQCRSFLQFPMCCGSSTSYNPKSNSSSPVKGKLTSLQNRTTNTTFLGPLFPSNQAILIPRRRCRNISQFIIELRATENDSQESDSITTAATTKVEEESSSPSSSDGEHRGEEEFSNIGDEIRKIREEKSGEGGGGGGLSWGAVTEEIGQIEWPEFQKVIRTTGVVLAVIAGSSVVLLTVNAVLAELSDKVFAGRGIQDFFH